MNWKNDFYKRRGKLLLDRIVTGVSLFILSPLMLIIAILVKLNLGSPVLFKQERTGYNGAPFFIYKFRSMTNERDKNGKLLPDEIRLNTFGRKLRSTSLDELPELINVLRGEMSLVGPRPLPVRYLGYYTEAEMHRHDVRPGITGLAQVNGRSFITWEKIFAYDVEYAKNVSFFGDLIIIIKTVVKVLKRENIADVAAARVDSEGKLHFGTNGKDIILHQPLDKERKKA